MYVFRLEENMSRALGQLSICTGSGRKKTVLYVPTQTLYVFCYISLTP